MIKRGDKGTVYAMKARIIDVDLKGEESLAIAVIDGGGIERVITRKGDGSSIGPEGPFIPLKPWDSLKPGDACFVRDRNDWITRVFAGVSAETKKPLTFNRGVMKDSWRYCVPAKLIDGELIPVEES